MLLAEVALLIAIRERLIANATFASGACDIELDDQVPAIAGAEYCAVIGAGTRPGPRHSSSGGVIDAVYSVRVVLYHRIAHVARDKRRTAYVSLLSGLNARLDEIIRLIDFRYELLADAKAILNETFETVGKYPEPFRDAVPDATPQAVYRDPYAAANMPNEGDPIIALRRGVVFSGARFMNTRDGS